MNRISGIKAVSFDADGALWDFDKVMRHSLGHALRELESVDAEAASVLDIEKMIAVRQATFEEMKGRATNLEEIRLETFRRSLRHAGRPDDALASRLNDIYLKHRYEDIEIFDDVRPTLSALRQRYAVGLISNGNTLPERCGLDGVFQFVVFSQDHGVEKPDPRIFMTALEQAPCVAEELLHVGDSLENDVMGATSGGIRSVCLNRNGAETGSCIEAQYEISSLAELLGFL